jgi:hypothetical protein
MQVSRSRFYSSRRQNVKLHPTNKAFSSMHSLLKIPKLSESLLFYNIFM